MQRENEKMKLSKIDVLPHKLVKDFKGVTTLINGKREGWVQGFNVEGYSKWDLRNIYNGRSEAQKVIKQDNSINILLLCQE